jgi:hypothetical protein
MATQPRPLTTPRARSVCGLSRDRDVAVRTCCTQARYMCSNVLQRSNGQLEDALGVPTSARPACVPERSRE